MTADRRLQEFVRLFNQKHFFEAHEVLEELWLESNGEVKDFYKGLIQCAAAFVHLQKHNYLGARSLLHRSAAHLRRFIPEYSGIQTEKFLREVEQFFENAESHDMANSETPNLSL